MQKNQMIGVRWLKREKETRSISNIVKLRKTQTLGNAESAWFLSTLAQCESHFIELATGKLWSMISFLLPRHNSSGVILHGMFGP